MSAAKKSSKNVSPKSLEFGAITNFEKVLDAAEKKYDAEVTTLLRAIDIAEKAQDTATLRACAQISRNWTAYFRSLSEIIGKNCSQADKSAETSIEFIEGQVKFFEILAEEIDKKISEIRAIRIRKLLE